MGMVLRYRDWDVVGFAVAVAAALVGRLLVIACARRRYRNAGWLRASLLMPALGWCISDGLRALTEIPLWLYHVVTTVALPSDTVCCASAGPSTRAHNEAGILPCYDVTFLNVAAAALIALFWG